MFHNNQRDKITKEIINIIDNTDVNKEIKIPIAMSAIKQVVKLLQIQAYKEGGTLGLSLTIEFLKTFQLSQYEKEQIK